MNTGLHGLTLLLFWAYTACAAAVVVAVLAVLYDERKKK